MGECALRMVNDEEAPGGEAAGNVQPDDRAASGHDGACVAHRDPAESLRALHDVAAVVSQSPALAKALNAVLDRLLDLARADIGAIHLVEEGSGELCLVASRGLSEAFRVRESRIPRGACLCGLSLAMDDPLVVDDLAEDARLSRPACLDERVGSLVSVPLRSRDRTLGLLTLYAREPRAFQAIDRTLLSAIGWELGVAVENARWFAAMRESAVAEERAVIAAELHDGIAQSLAYLNVQSARVEQLLQGGETEGARRELDGIREVIRATYEDVRQLLVDFRAAPKEGGAFASSLHAHLATFELRNQIRAELVGEECLQGLAFYPQAEVFRMVQEALANVRKHARASQVRVVCARMPAAWEIRVEDNGVGCDATRFNDPSGAHLGLRIMRERAARVGGSVRLSSTPGRGTTVMIEVPVGSDEDGSAR